MRKSLLKEATRAIEKSSASLVDSLPTCPNHFASFNYGYIDYTLHQDTIGNLIRAINERKICEVTYMPALSDKPKTYFIKPLKLFSHKDTLYLSSAMARVIGKPFKKHVFDPLLAVHRIKTLEVTERSFEFPKSYNFGKHFDGNFGIIKSKPFKVEVVFSGYAALYVSERIWSSDQKIKRLKNKNIQISFTASSLPEINSWIKSFGSEAILLKPRELR